MWKKIVYDVSICLYLSLKFVLACTFVGKQAGHIKLLCHLWVSREKDLDPIFLRRGRSSSEIAIHSGVEIQPLDQLIRWRAFQGIPNGVLAAIGK